MKKLFTSLLVTALTGIAMEAGVTLPYSSDMFVDVSKMDEGWTSSNSANRKAEVWCWDRDNTGTALATPGTSSAACKPYDSSCDADCWMYSPAIDLKAGGNYVVGIWAKTKGSDDENFKICYGSEAAASAMTNVIVDKKEYLNSSDYEFVSGTLTPESDMTVYFGINCYTPSNHYVLSVTGFVVSDENGNLTPSSPVDPEPGEAIALPFSYDFLSKSDFAKDWTTGFGEDAGVKQNWIINEYSKWAVFDVAQNEKENNWVISPELNFEEAGDYVMVYTGLITGKLEFLVGTGTEDLSAFTSVGTKEVNDSYDNDAVYEIPFVINEAGKYRVAVRAAADNGTFMGYRMVNLKVRGNKPVPAAVNDLSATPDADDNLSVALCWTNPATDHLGNTLGSISRIELFRNGVMVKDDFLILTPGATNAWLDEPEAAGVYSYHVVAYNENGAVDAVPMEVSAGYVGRPVADMPFSASYSESEKMLMFTSVDNNADGVMWRFKDGESSWDRYMKISTVDPAEFDDYLVSPYLHLIPGYYKLTAEFNAKYNSLELGYTDNRHEPAAGFVKLTEVSDCRDYRYEPALVFEIKDEGDYALCAHATGLSSDPSYRSISFNSISLMETPVLPATVSNLSGDDRETENGFQVTLGWTNPSVDNAGNDLPEDTAFTITIRRDGETVATLEGDEYGVGADCSWSDELSEEGDYVYSVEAATAAGAAEEDAPEVSVHVCAVMKLPYSTVDFSNWNIPYSWYSWKIDEASLFAVWEEEYVYSFEYSVFTPFMRLESGKAYLMTAIFDGCSEEMPMTLVSAPEVKESSATTLHSFALPQDALDHKLTLKLLPAQEAAAAVADDDDVEATSVVVPAGKMIVGFRPQSKGKVTLKSFSLSELIPSGVGEVQADKTPTFAGGVLSYPETTDIAVCDLAGRVLCRTRASELNLGALGLRGVVIVAAPGYATVKIVL